MGIGTADGKYFEDDTAHTLDQIEEFKTNRAQPIPMTPINPLDYMMDPVDPKGTFHDEPTTEALGREKDRNQNNPARFGAPITQIQNIPKTDSFEERWNNMSTEHGEEILTNIRDLSKPKEDRSLVGILTGSDNKERYQLWPERMVRGMGDTIVDGLNLMREVAHGETDPMAPRSIERAFSLAALTIFGGSPATVSLRSAESTLTSLQEQAARLPRDHPFTLNYPVEVGVSRGNPLDNEFVRDSLRSLQDPTLRRRALEALNDYRASVGDVLPELTRGARNLTEQEMRELYRRSAQSRNPRGWGAVEGSGIQASRESMAIITFKNPEGKEGVLWASQIGDIIKVYSIASSEGHGVFDKRMLHTMGISGMRQVLKELQDKFPEATHISGFRVTGANPNTTKLMKLPPVKARELVPGDII